MAGAETNPEAPRAPGAEPGVLRAGSVIAGRYEVRGLVGAGGMGAVYRVHDRELREDVALKFLRPERLADASSVERFRREVRLARRIGHPNVCRVFDLGEVDGVKFLTMEWVEGRSLRAVLRDGALSPARAMEVLLQVTAGVAAAHDLGIIHRDIKPENVLVEPAGRIKVADFGLAVGVASESATATSVGTPQYMSPEQLRGEPVGKASDVFALGLVGHELFMGKSPFGDGLPAVITSAILRDAPRALDVPDLLPEVSRPLTEALSRALEKRPEDRFEDASALSVALSAIPAIAGARSSRRATTEPGPAPPGDIPPAGSTSSGAMATAKSLPGRRETGPPARKSRIPSVTVGVLALAAATATAYKMYSSPAPEPRGSSSAPVASPGSSVERPSIDANVVVFDFEDLAHEKEWDGLAPAAREAVRAALRGVPGVKLSGRDEPAAQGSLAVHGSVQRIGPKARLSVRFERDGQPAGETVDIDGPGAQPAELIDQLKGRVVDEAQLLVREHQRRARAASETENDEARRRLLDYYEKRALFGDLTIRRERLEEILKLDGRYVSARLEHAEIMAQLAGSREDLERALAEVGAVLADEPGDARALTQQCRYRRYLASFEAAPSDALLDAAEASCKAALAADSRSSVVLLTLAKLFAKRCEPEKAIAHLQEALARDRARAAEILPIIATIALEDGKLPVADEYSARFVTLQDDEDRLRSRALGHRAGMAPAQGAHLLRGSVLLRLGRVADARAAFEEELKRPRLGLGAEETEVAALYGLKRVAAAGAGPMRTDLHKRLLDAEAKRRAPEEQLGFAGEIAKASPEDALVWLDKARSSPSCSTAIVRAAIHASMNDRPNVARALSSCEPATRWERGCVTRLLAR